MDEIGPFNAILNQFTFENNILYEDMVVQYLGSKFSEWNWEQYPNNRFGDGQELLHGPFNKNDIVLEDYVDVAIEVVDSFCARALKNTDNIFLKNDVETTIQTIFRDYNIRRACVLGNAFQGGELISMNTKSFYDKLSSWHPFSLFYEILLFHDRNLFVIQFSDD
jgi:hypothetical protein